MSPAARNSSTRSAGKSRSINDLYSRFEKARTAANAIVADEPKFNREAARLGRMVAQIAKAPAKSVPEMLLKIDAVTTERADAEYACLVSLRKDLQRLQDCG